MNDAAKSARLAESMFRAQFESSVDELRQSGRHDLADLMQKRWYSIFYNDPRHTLKKGKLYLIGLNPGGADNCDYNTGKANMAEWWEHKEKREGKPYSAYYEGEWSQRLDAGQSPHQKNVRRLLHHLWNDVSKETATRYTFAANLCFFRTPNSKMLKQYPTWNKLLEYCWTHHERFLSIVQPEIIICNGYTEGLSSFWQMRRKLDQGSTTQCETINSVRKVKWFHTKLNDCDEPRTLVVGIPHLSRPCASIEDILAAVDRVIER